jgi:hypothetical protein
MARVSSFEGSDDEELDELTVALTTELRHLELESVDLQPGIADDDSGPRKGSGLLAAGNWLVIHLGVAGPTRSGMPRGMSGRTGTSRRRNAGSTAPKARSSSPATRQAS